jgi:hypothetical protein
MAVRIAMRMGNEMACLAVPHDFSIIDPQSRRLFRNVDLTTTPANGEAAIRTEIRRLHRLMLNEDLPEGHPELEATYQLWVAAHEAVGATSGSRPSGGMGTRRPRCEATGSFEATPVPYPNDAHRVVNQQSDSTVRPWMAVIAYLLSDARFFLQ